ncbi:mediator of RNA polymerase II transcription subunit 10b-like [Solanum tuberosum]|uniref:Mediator of RNA polymerase II transcription subunit 10 n=1 Tax=Solanum tuberosum TaxID=4113 RepID=M1DIE9_SOLTU|nr:PREDICTED: mediator of RNA polymerase II transcription subunit 10b-like [Solanum tuberosum]
MDSSKQNLNEVTNSIDKTLEILNQLYLTSSSNDVIPLVQGMNNLVLELDNMAKLGEKYYIQVSIDVMNLIDDGKNSDEYTRDMLNSCIARNQITKGKTNAFKDLRGHFLEELDQAFPNEVEACRLVKHLL